MHNTNTLQDSINYHFKDENTLIIALTHPSYANEHNIEKSMTNQRLEFLGDAVLELISSDFLYKLYPDKDEGYLTKTRSIIVCEESLSSVARDIDLSNFLLIGNGEDKLKFKNNNSVMCDALEALIGAIYIDGGLDSAKDFINKFILTDKNIHKENFDYKSLIQEIANEQKIKINYELIKEEGPDHKKTFYVNIHYGDSVVCLGIGSSKKEAEQNAAKVALKSIK